MVAVARGLEAHPEEELESESNEEEDDSASVISVATTNNGDRTKPLGYGSFSKKIGRNARDIKKWGKSFEGLEQRILTKCTQVIQQQLAQTIQLQIKQALERALSPEKLQPLIDLALERQRVPVPKSNPTTVLEITGTDGSPGRDSGPRNPHRRHADAARVSDTRLPPPSARTCGKGAAQGVCTFIRKGIAHVKHQQFLGSRDTAIELCVTELAISGKGRGTRGGRKKETSITVFIANIYSNPRHGKQKFKTLFHKIKSATSQAQKDLVQKRRRCRVDNIDEWSAKLLAATEGATDEPEEIETMDPRLAHLLEAWRSLQKRWRRQRHNRKLRKKIAELGREIERHSRQLCSQQWFALCSQADGQLHRGGTWKLLRQLMDETKSCEYQRARMAQILHTTARQLGEEEMFKRLNERYLPHHQSRRPPRLRRPAEPPPRPRSRGMGTLASPITLFQGYTTQAHTLVGVPERHAHRTPKLP
ncbi:hypothetical protein MRX96_034523 [Rhipicephalus microplus]